jgi:general secretion pathway protein H
VTVAPRNSRDGQAGLTLVETLVTVAIVAVMAGLVTLGVARVGAAGGAADEAARLAAVLDAGADAALASGRDRVLTWGPDSYALEGAEVHRLPAGVALARADGSAAPILLSGSGAAPAVALVLRDRRGARGVWFDGLRARVAGAGAGATP